MPDGIALPFNATWVVLPTYNEADYLARMVTPILDAVPGVHVLVEDDHSPDGAGELADGLSRQNDAVEVLNRTGKEGLGAAYRAGFAAALANQQANGGRLRSLSGSFMLRR